MTVNPADRFRTSSSLALAAVAGLPDATPSVLSEVCVAVLTVDAAGITMTQDPPLPLGSSDPWAALMEQVQATLGDGPCVSSVAGDPPVVFDEATLVARWPLYFAELRQQTPFRSTVSLPLALTGQQRFGTLDLFSDDPSGQALAFALEWGGPIATQVTELIYASLYGRAEDHELPAWLDADAPAHRTDVWLAVELVSDEGLVDASTALAALRSYAYLHGVGLDDVAADVATRRLAPGDVLG